MCINDLSEDNDDYNNNVMLDDDSLVGISAHGYNSDAPDFVGVSRARSLTHMIDWYNISENDDEDDVDELD
jgi:hypothetical protein